MTLLSPQLEAFVAVAQYKTVHAAASAVHVTQTAVTQRIQNLEAKLSTTLFLRTRQGMVLTPEGEALLRYCNAAQELAGEALAKIQKTGIESEIQLTISGPTSLLISRIIPQCTPVLKKFTKLLIRYDINNENNRAQSLRSGHSQLAIIHQDEIVQEMEYKLLKPEQYVLVCSPGWKTRKLNDIIKNERIIDFDPTDQMTFNYLKEFDLFSISKKDRHFANHTEALARMVIDELGYGLLTKEFAKPYVEKNQLIILNQGKYYNNVPVLAWFSRPVPPKYFTALIQAIS